MLVDRLETAVVSLVQTRQAILMVWALEMLGLGSAAKISSLVPALKSLRMSALRFSYILLPLPWVWTLRIMSASHSSIWT